MRNIVGWTLILGCAVKPPGFGAPEPDFSDPASLVSVTLWEPEIELSGVFADRGVLRFHQEVERQGNCRLMGFTPTTCDPVCPPSSACVEGICTPWPVRSDRGPLRWAWEGGSMVLSPDGIDGYSGVGGGATPGPTSIQFDDQNLAAEVPALLRRRDWDRVFSNRSGAVVLGWSNPEEGARVSLRMTDCTGSHGGMAAYEIECEGPDSGELTIPGAFLDRLDAGAWDQGECGSHRFVRSHNTTVDGVTLRGQVRSDFFYYP